MAFIGKVAGTFFSSPEWSPWEALGCFEWRKLTWATVWFENMFPPAQSQITPSHFERNSHFSDKRNAKEILFVIDKYKFGTHIFMFSRQNIDCKRRQIQTNFFGIFSISGFPNYYHDKHNGTTNNPCGVAITNSGMLRVLQPNLSISIIIVNLCLQ